MDVEGIPAVFGTVFIIGETDIELDSIRRHSARGLGATFDNLATGHVDHAAVSIEVVRILASSRLSVRSSSVAMFAEVLDVNIWILP